MGNITYEDVLTVQPFDNTVDLVTMNGEGLRASLEAAAFSLVAGDPEAYPGFGYQLSGLRVNITVEEDNQGSRVTELLVKQEDGSYAEVEDDKVTFIEIKRETILEISRCTELFCRVFWLEEEREKSRKRCEEYLKAIF